MDNWKIEATKHTPAMEFDATTNVLSIVGECYPENVGQVSIPLFTWFSTYLTQTPPELVLTVNVEITYFNSSSSKMLLDFFDRLEEAVTEGNNIVVNWTYDANDDIGEEFGEEFKEDLEVLTFNLVKK